MSVSSNRENMSFDFNRAVEEARRDYPVETQDITFIDATKPEKEDQLAGWLAATAPSYQEFINETVMFIIPGHLCELMQLMTGGSFSMRDPITGKGALVISPTEKVFSTLVPGAAAATVFNHELGHLLAEGGMLNSIQDMVEKSIQDMVEKDPEKMREREIVADLFAALRGIQQGCLVAGDIAKMAAFRVNANDITHDSSAALGAVLKEEGALEGLTPRKVKAMAGKFRGYNSPA